MAVYVYRDGELVERHLALRIKSWNIKRSDLPAPRVSRFETMESPVTGKDVTSWRERDRDMDAAGCVDPRDLPRGPFEQREREYARRRELDAAAAAARDDTPA